MQHNVLINSPVFARIDSRVATVLGFLFLPGWARQEVDPADTQLLFLHKRIRLLAIIGVSLLALSISQLVLSITLVYTFYFWIVLIPVVTGWLILCVLVRVCPFRSRQFKSRMVSALNYLAVFLFISRLCAAMWMFAGLSQPTTMGYFAFLVIIRSVVHSFMQIGIPFTSSCTAHSLSCTQR